MNPKYKDKSKSKSPACAPGEQTVKLKLMDSLLPYQREWATDQSRWKFGLMARQVGKDHAAATEGILDCAKAESEGRKTTWLIVAPSERQSLEALQKWKEQAELLNMTIASFELVRAAGHQSLLQTGCILFPHGSRVIAVPGKPETLRGYCANILLTEFAFFENLAAIWKAILPMVVNALRGLLKMRVITSANGFGSFCHDLWQKNHLIPGAQWSCHLVDIYRAVRDGLPVNLEEIKAALNDPEGWAQEFECQFIDVLATLLPYELIATCESPEAGLQTNPLQWGTIANSPIVLGLDYARKGHLSVACASRKMGDVLQVMEFLEMKEMSTPEQIALLRPRIRAASRVCLDVTGSGTGMGDYLVKEFGEWNPPKHQHGKIELCVFTNEFKNSLCSNMRQAFELRGVRIPVSTVVREDLHSLSRVVTRAGHISYRAPYTSDGHADRAMALALAIRAGAQQRPRCDIESVPNTNPRWVEFGGGTAGPPSVYQRNMENMNRRARERWGIKIPRGF
jgi:phage FluMu gp28-like protein